MKQIKVCFDTNIFIHLAKYDKNPKVLDYEKCYTSNKKLCGNIIKLHKMIQEKVILPIILPPVAKEFYKNSVGSKQIPIYEYLNKINHEDLYLNCDEKSGNNLAEVYTKEIDKAEKKLNINNLQAVHEYGKYTNDRLIASLSALNNLPVVSEDKHLVCDYGSTSIPQIIAKVNKKLGLNSKNIPYTLDNFFEIFFNKEKEDTKEK